MPSKTRRKLSTWKLLSAALVAAILVVGLLLWLRAANQPVVDRGPVFPAVEQTLAQGGPVKDDLIKRGLFVAPQSAGGTGQIKVADIEKLVNSGVYVLDAQGRLQFGPNYRAP